jgi:hypothetical protein
VGFRGFHLRAVVRDDAVPRGQQRGHPAEYSVEQAGQNPRGGERGGGDGGGEGFDREIAGKGPKKKARLRQGSHRHKKAPFFRWD